MLAIDRADQSREVRLTNATRILELWSVHEISTDVVLEACDRLHKTLENRWPLTTIIRETPVSAKLEGQLINGRIDLLVEGDDGYVIIDHKSYPGGRAEQERRAAAYGGQLELYRLAVKTATLKPCTELWIHMPISGSLQRIERVIKTNQEGGRNRHCTQ